MNARYTSSDRNEFTMHNQLQLDLLIDGELPDDQRRELLAGLDSTPDGWRRCALAFLEAQSWRREMSAVVGDSLEGFSKNVAARSVRPTAVKAQAGGNGRTFSTPLAMAASLLIAFAMGLAVRPPLNHMTTGGTNGGADSDPSSTSAVQLAVQGSEDSGASDPANEPLRDDKGGGYRSTGRWGTAKLVVDNGPDGGSREVELPAVESDSWDESLLTSSPAVIPPELQQVFERLGHRVLQERELMSFELNDGRQMVVPVDKVSFTPVASRSYQ